MRNASTVESARRPAPTARLRATLRELGAKVALLYWSDRALNAVSRGRVRLRLYRLVVQPLPSRADRPRGTSISVRPLEPADLDRLPLPVAREVVEQRLGTGANCFVAELRGEFAGYAWFQAGPYEEDEVRCTFVPEPRESTLWDFDVYIEPRFRLSRAFVRLWEGAAEALRARGFTHTASRISAYNSASLRAHANLGSRIVGAALFFTVGVAQLMIATSPPFVHLGLTRTSAPRLRVTTPRIRLSASERPPDHACQDHGRDRIEGPACKRTQGGRDGHTLVSSNEMIGGKVAPQVGTPARERKRWRPSAVGSRAAPIGERAFDD